MMGSIPNRGTSNTSSTGTLYFGYGSNLWQHQMQLRCRTSNFLGIARLNGYRWIINERGYANVVEVASSSDDVVWGLVYRLQPTDEERLDIQEAVPRSYTKEYLDVDFWEKQTSKEGGSGGGEMRKEKMLVYVDRKRTQPDEPKKEYVYRMNMGIKDALKEGVPEKYVQEVMRKFILDVEDEHSQLWESVAALARQQALSFKEER